MDMPKRIISLILAVVVLNLQFHIFESVSWSQENNYSICALECEHNEHGTGKLDCEVCLKNIRTDFFVHGKEYSYRKNIKCYFNCNSKIISNNFFIAFTSRAPPSILL